MLSPHFTLGGNSLPKLSTNVRFSFLISILVFSAVSPVAQASLKLVLLLPQPFSLRCDYKCVTLWAFLLLFLKQELRFP